MPIRLIGGILLVKITWDLVNNSEDAIPDSGNAVKANNNFWRAVSSIILADISMSLDNVLAVGGAADGNIGLIAFGILLNLPLLFFGSKLVANLMNKYKIVIYIGAGILIHTALAMIFEDRFVAPLIPHIAAIILPWGVAFGVLGWGYYLLSKQKLAKDNARLVA